MESNKNKTFRAKLINIPISKREEELIERFFKDEALKKGAWYRLIALAELKRHGIQIEEDFAMNPINKIKIDSAESVLNQTRDSTLSIIENLLSFNIHDFIGLRLEGDKIYLTFLTNGCQNDKEVCIKNLQLSEIVKKIILEAFSEK